MDEVLDSAPTSLDQVAMSLLESLLAVWASFVNHLPYIVMGVVVLFLTWGVSAVFQKFSHLILGKSKFRDSLKDLIERLIVVGIWFAGLMLAAMVLFPGLTPAKALGGLGLLSVAVGFAFRDVFENFLAGILILWRFPFENGDFIECNGIVGRVEEVTIRMTKIRQVSDELIIVPNAVIFKNPVQVLTNKPKRRTTVMTGVGYGENVSKSLDVIRQAVEACKTVDQNHPLQIFANGFGASSIDIEVTYWTDPTPLAIRESKSEVIIAVKSALDEAGIEIPFPYRTHTFAEPMTVQMQESKSGETN